MALAQNLMLLKTVQIFSWCPLLVSGDPSMSQLPLSIVLPLWL